MSELEIIISKNLNRVDICPNISTDDSIGTVRLATLDDIPYVIDLAKKEANCLGFIPKMAYTSAITGIKTGKRWSNTCNDRLFVITSNDDLVGFCLCSFGRVNAKLKIGKIAQIVLQEDARKIQRGRILLDTAVEYGKYVRTRGFLCGCADDLPSNFFWGAMGWIRIGERKGISCKNTWKETSDRQVNIYKSTNLHDLNLGIDGKIIPE